MTNKEVIEINQKAWESHPIKDLPSGFEHARVWGAQTDTYDLSRPYFAFFNLDDEPVILHATWKQLGLPASTQPTISGAAARVALGKIPRKT
jgi:hypothetical protein